MDDEIINLQDNHCYVLRDHECYFNWIDKEFDLAKATERMATRRCIEMCSNIADCEYCCFDGKWRDTVEPTEFFDGDDDDEIASRDRGHFHKFVSWNGEMIFLETFIGDYDKAEHRLDYLHSTIGRNGRRARLDYLDGYEYICETLGAYVKFCKISLSRSDRASLQSFNSLNLKAQIGVLSVKFLFVKATKESFNTQIQILRKVSDSPIFLNQTLSQTCDIDECFHSI